jgi:hypothetical protein
MATSATKTVRSAAALFTPELVEAQGRADREYLTTQVKLLLEAKQAHPSASFADLAALAPRACGCGCCCCCSTLSLGADVINPAPTALASE